MLPRRARQQDAAAAARPDDVRPMRTSRAVASANIDVSDQLADALPVYLAVVIGLSLLILLVGVLFGPAMDYQLFLV